MLGKGNFPKLRSRRLRRKGKIEREYTRSVVSGNWDARKRRAKAKSPKMAHDQFFLPICMVYMPSACTSFTSGSIRVSKF